MINKHRVDHHYADTSAALAPAWISEKKDFEVYSCHVSADGSRLVTAAGDGFVRIWSTDAVYKSNELEYKGPRQLAALNYHSGTIHAARFSGNNKYLASGADDKIVCVYTLDPNPPSHTTFGSNDQPPVENWRIYRRLIGHENDVQDLGWSHDSSILVSVGLDSRIVVWSGYTFEKLKTISSHSSHVKGLTFDPAGKYFATASDDRSIKIFRYTSPERNSTAQDQVENFVQEASIVDPFVTSPLSTYFRRCSWSPDGVHIAAANATNGPVSTAAIINRGSWDSEINLVGHEGPLEVCAFSPRIFSDRPYNPSNPQSPTSTVIACAGQDRALSFWNTASSKPLVVSEGLCMKSISDLAWSADGEHCFYTSLDGTIALARFKPGELGFTTPLEVNESSLAKYGAGRKVGVIEGRDGLLLEDMSKEDEMRSARGRMGELMGDQPSVNGAPNGVHMNGKAIDGSKAPEKDQDVNMLTNGQTENGDAAKKQSVVVEDPNQAKIDRLKQKVTVTKDGKKRVAPLLVSSTAGSQESSMPTAQLMASHQQNKAAGDAPHTILDLSKPFEGLPKGGLASLIIGNRRRFAETGGEDDNIIRQRVDAAERQGATPVMANTEHGLVLANRNLANSTEQWPAPVNPLQQISQLRLAVPQVRAHIVRPVGGTISPGENNEGDKPAAFAEDAHVLEVRNAGNRTLTGRPQDREPARVSVMKRGQQLWQDFLPRPVMLVTGNKRYWAAACDDGSVFVWTPAGRRLFNAFALESQVSILDCRGPWLLAVTSVGLCHIWNIDKSTSPHPPISVAPLLDIAAHAQGLHLTNGPGIIFARLNSEGRVVVAMSNGEAFTYSTTMYVWQRLSEPWWAVGSQYWNTSDSFGSSNKGTNGKGASTKEDENELLHVENLSAGIIPLLERNTTSQVLLRGKAFFLQRLVKALLSAEGYEGFEAGVSVAHLENRLAAALSLGAKDEFKLYLNMYAKRLGAEGSRLKIEELLRSLIAGVLDDGEDAEQSTLRDSSNSYLGGPADELCGWKKEGLLKDVVLILGKYRDLQRTVVPYARVLGITNIEAGAEGDADEAMDGSS